MYISLSLSLSLSPCVYIRVHVYLFVCLRIFKDIPFSKGKRFETLDNEYWNAPRTINEIDIIVYMNVYIHMYVYIYNYVNVHL